ncbi:MAG: pyridoxamine 5'-phosphate oxidase family protein [Lachnospirales bacterium]
MSIEKVNDYLTEAKSYFLTTVKDNKPKCRPIGLNLLIEGKIYFGVGDFKEVYKQMQENPYVEICAMVNNKFLRYHGKAVFTTNEDIAKNALEAIPVLKNIYNDETGHKIKMFCLEEATADFYNGVSLDESISL